MALKNQQNNYLKIEKVDYGRSIIFLEMWKDEPTRQVPTQFDAKVTSTIHAGKLEEKMDTFTTTGNIRDDLIACGYLALKEEPPYNGAGGEVWTDC